MASTDVELEQQLKEAGKQLLHPPASVDELLPVLDQVEKLLSKVDQSPKKPMQDALKPSMNALIHDSLSRHSDADVKVAVASCISEITRITAPDAPYNDDQMRDVFQLIVSSFEHLADQSSRSYNKRASILETVSKVRSCVIMLDLECDGLIVEMFEHFLRSVRDYHLDSVYSSMENIMVLVLEESEEVSVEMLKPLLASVKKDSEGVLPVARKLAEGVLLKSAAKLKPYLMPAVISLGDTLDKYTQVVASVCEGTTATYEHNDENASGLQLANESKLEKESLDEAQQADESKLTTASSNHTDQVAKEAPCPEEADPNLDRSPKSVMSNGVNVIEKEEASVDQESKKPEEEDTSQRQPNLTNKEDTDDSDADVAKAESKPEPEQSSKKGGKKTETIVNSREPSDSSHVEGEKEEVKVKLPDESQRSDSPVKESSIEPVIPSEIEKDNDVKVSSPKTIESKATNVSNSSPSEIEKDSDESSVKKTVRSKKKPVPQKDEIVPENAATASPSKSGSPPGETRSKKVGRAKNKGLTQEKSTKEVVVAKEVEANSDTSDSDEKPLRKSSKKVDAVKSSGSKSTKQSGKRSKSKQSGKKVDAKPLKGEESDSDAKPLKMSVKKGEKSKVTVEEEEESDSETKPLKMSGGKKGKNVTEKKDDGKKRGVGKNVIDKDQAKNLSGDDEVDSSPKSATKSVKETPGASSKRKRTPGKDKESDTIKYDESLVGQKVKVWWPEDKTYYEGVVEAFYSAKKKHKVSYVDGDEETLNLKTQKWEILEEFSVRDEEQNIEAQSEEASPDTHKRKKSKADPASSASQEKIKDSAKRAGGVSSSGKAKGSASKDNKSKDNSGAKSSGKSTDAASKEAGKSNEDEETPKVNTKTKAVNKSKGKTGQSGSKSNANGPAKSKSGSAKSKEDEEETPKATENVKTPESTKGKSTGGSKSGKKRKKRT